MHGELSRVAICRAQTDKVLSMHIASITAVNAAAKLELEVFFHKFIYATST